MSARDAIKGKWGIAVGAFFLFTLLTSGMGFVPKVGGLVQLIMSGPLAIGISAIALAFIRKGAPQVADLFAPFNKFWRAFGAILLYLLFLFLWALIAIVPIAALATWYYTSSGYGDPEPWRLIVFLPLLIPAIIAWFRYDMTFYVLAEDANIRPKAAIDKSKALMRGNKGKLFKLYFSFIGWGLLSALTAGIGLLWLIPYVGVSTGAFYEDIQSASSPEKSDSKK